MSKIARFVIWICSKFTRNEIEQIITGLLDVINNRNPEVKPKDDFKEQHPNYRNFYAVPNPPLTAKPTHKKEAPNKNYKLLLAEYKAKCGKPLPPVKHRSNSPKVPENTTCPNCNAPHIYIYYNDGKKKTQLLCKVCNNLFQINKILRKDDKTKYYCTHCNYALFILKVRR